MFTFHWTGNRWRFSNSQVTSEYSFTLLNPWLPLHAMEISEMHLIHHFALCVLFSCTFNYARTQWMVDLGRFNPLFNFKYQSVGYFVVIIFKKERKIKATFIKHTQSKRNPAGYRLTVSSCIHQISWSINNNKVAACMLHFFK